jgi:hypothetical protein
MTIPITDEMVERAAWHFCPHIAGHHHAAPNAICDKTCGTCRFAASAALKDVLTPISNPVSPPRFNVAAQVASLGADSLFASLEAALKGGE